MKFCAVALTILTSTFYSTSYTEPRPVTSGLEAIFIAKACLGFPFFDSIATAVDSLNGDKHPFIWMATRDVPTDDRTPFFHDIIANGGAWCVRFTNARLGPDDTLYHNLQVLIEVNTGALLSIEGKSVTIDSTILPRLKAEVSTAHLRNCREVYELADSLPELPLYELMEMEPWRSLAYSRDFDAQFVRWTHLEQPARLVWIVTFRGMQPLARRKGQVPDWQINHERMIFDGTNGKALRFSNFPQTEAPKEFDSIGQ